MSIGMSAAPVAGLEERDRERGSRVKLAYAGKGRKSRGSID